MKKRIKTVVPETQQEITANIERDGEQFNVEILASTDLDEDLRSEFREAITPLGTEQVTVTPKTRKSNQGNDLYETVTVEFATSEQLGAIDIIGEAVEIGQEYHETQLERNLNDEDKEGTGYWYTGQQKHFVDEELKEFCLLYR